MRKLVVSVMCLLMLLTGCANESDVKMNKGALPAAQMDAVQNDVRQPTVAVDVRKVDTTEPVAEIKTETAPAKETTTVTPRTVAPQPQQESKTVNALVTQTPEVKAVPVVDSAKTDAVSVTDSAKTDTPVIIDSAKTGIPVVIDSAKTNPHASTVIEAPDTPQPAAKTADLDEVMDEANAYAAGEYGVIIDTGLSFDNSGYRFPAYAHVTAPQSDVVAKAKDMVDYTFQQLMVVNRKTMEDVRSAGFGGNVYAYMDGESIVIYFFYR